MSMSAFSPVEPFDPSQDPARGLSIRILNVAVEDKAATEAQGFTVYKDVPFIKVRIPGDSTFERFAEITEEEKRLYPRHWAKFLADNKSEGIVGSILDEWSPMPRSAVETFRHFGIRTVEQLAAMPDANARTLPRGVEWRDKAKGWLERATAAAPMAKLETENRSMKDEMAAMKRQLDDAMKQLDRLTDPKKKG